LAQRFPKLAQALPWVSLGSFPVPLESVLLGAEGNPTFAKREDLSNATFGGGKVRKLELLFGEALAAGHRDVVTFGAAGSNQALAVALLAPRAGLSAIVELGGQKPSPEVAHHLRALTTSTAEIHAVAGTAEAEQAAFRRLRREGKSAPWVIPAGGTWPSGTLGFVDAALEVVEQLRAQGAPMPESLFVAAGTMGTAVGLALGLALAGVKTRVVAVRCSSPELSSDSTVRRVTRETVDFARARDPAFPELTLDSERLVLEGRYLGPGYGSASPAGRSALAYAAEHHTWHLDPTYTAKTLAALLDSAPRRPGDALFWLTQSAAPLPEQTPDVSRLPRSLRALLLACRERPHGTR
jgi:1-aminocyclopropane-1-carboxylate deaminase/D-cysteine desulfhydrase-like pyridoxal-dependent ACC family enzyme